MTLILLTGLLNPKPAILPLDYMCKMKTLIEFCSKPLGQFSAKFRIDSCVRLNWSGWLCPTDVENHLKVFTRIKKAFRLSHGIEHLGWEISQPLNSNLRLIFDLFMAGIMLSVQQTKTGTCTNSVDPAETACNEPSHQNLHFLPFCFWF